MAGRTTANRASGASRSSLSTRLAVVTVANRCEASAQGAMVVGGPWGGEALAHGGGGGCCGNTVDSVHAYPSHQRCPGPPAGSGYQPGARLGSRSGRSSQHPAKAQVPNQTHPPNFPARRCCVAGRWCRSSWRAEPALSVDPWSGTCVTNRLSRTSGPRGSWGGRRRIRIGTSPGPLSCKGPDLTLLRFCRP